MIVSTVNLSQFELECVEVMVLGNKIEVVFEGIDGRSKYFVKREIEVL